MDTTLPRKQVTTNNMYSTYLKLLVSDGYNITQETSNNQQYV